MLINDISRAFAHKMRKAADEECVPFGYRHLLFYLAHNDGISQLELAKRTNLTPPTVSVTLQKMELDGYIMRTPSPEDQRQMIVCLTDKGKLIEKRLKEKADETEAMALSELDPSEVSQLKEYLLRIYEKMMPTPPCGECSCDDGKECGI